MKNTHPLPPDHLGRRRFLKSGSLITLASLVWPGRNASAAPGGGECEATTDDILGPYYLAGSPQTTQVAAPNEPGTRLFIGGIVLSNDCLTPVPGARIEVWQANDAAVYDTTPTMKLRATLFSDENGAYTFDSIMPGAYLNGAQYRPKHIHFRVNKVGFPELITQLYFEGDPYIAADPWASTAEAASRIIPLNEIDEDHLEGAFDIVLDGHVGIKPNRFGTDGDLLPINPNPMLDRCNIHFNVFHEARVSVHIADTSGRVLITLQNAQLAQGRYTTQWDGRDAQGNTTAPGTYLCLFQMDGRPVKAQRIVRI